MSQAPPRGGHSFMVVAYGDSPFLAGCLESLRAQAVASRVVISTSTPSDVIAETAARFGVEVIVNPEREGIGADWNFALRAAGTRYVTLAHQDDVYEPQFLQATLAQFARHPEAVLCFTGYQEVDDAGRPKSSKISRVKHLIEAATLGPLRLARGLPLRLFLSFGNPLPCSSVTLDLDALQGFAFDESYQSNLDWEAWWRLHRGRAFVRAPKRLVGRRHNPLTETSRLIRDGVRQAEDARMFAKIWPAPLDRAISALYAAGY